MYVDVEIEAAALDVLTQPAGVTRHFDCLQKNPVGQRIFRAQVDIALAGANRVARDDHALDKAHRIAFHEHAIGECAAISFVRITGDVFLVCGCVCNRTPLDAGRESGAATSAQARFAYGFEHCLAADFEMLFAGP